MKNIGWYKTPLSLEAPFNHAIRVKGWLAFNKRWGIALVKWDKKWVEEIINKSQIKG
ncbi:MAG: hypothetical protein WC479_07395 [Candidatus Izemoplasmatales bacterium]|jgi:hypothetical protein